MIKERVELRDVSVVICAYTMERWDALVRAIESVHEQEPGHPECIVVVDHCPELLERLRANSLGAVVVENGEQQGLSGARNSGVVAARGKFIAFLDDDAVAEPDWLAKMCRHFGDERVLGVGGKVDPLWASGYPARFPEEFYWVIGCSYRGLPRSLAVVRNPFGGCMCVRREVLEGVGGFPNGIGRVGNVPLGGEETALSIRAHQLWPGGVFLYEPSALIHHLVPAGRVRWGYLWRRCYYEGYSKYLWSKMTAARDGLDTEKSYLTRTLPRGFARGVADGLLRRDFAGLGRAAAIAVGVAGTGLGYMRGALSRPAPSANESQRHPALAAQV